MIPDHSNQYVAQVRKMADNAIAWKAAHPSQKPEVNFINPQKTVIVGAISDAVRVGYVKCNPAGLELLKAMWPWDVRTEPTVVMTQTALEVAYAAS